MKCTWRQLMLILVLLCCDGGSYESLQKYYIGYGEHNTQSAVEDQNEATDEPKRAIDMSTDRDRKREKDNVESETIRVKGLSERSSARKSRSLGNGFRYFPSLSPPNEWVRAGTNEKRPPIDVRQRVKSKREITPSYSISSDKYHVNISCHVAFKRSCALPDAAFIFKQMPFNDEEETTASWVGTEDVMELLTFQESSNQSGITAKAIHKTARDKHRVLNVADDESRCIIKDAVAFESSRVTKIWGEHGRAGPVVVGDASPLRDEIQQLRNLRKRRSPHWSIPYRQAIFDTGRLMTKYAKKTKSGLGRYIEKNEKDDSNGTKVMGEGKRCGLQNGECTPFPHKGHWCHYHYKNHKDRRTHYFRHNKTVAITKPPHCSTSSKGPTMSVTVISTKEEELLEPTIAPKRLEVTSKTKNATQVDDVEGAPRRTANQSRKMENLNE